jgi:plastocyanin
MSVTLCVIAAGCSKSGPPTPPKSTATPGTGEQPSANQVQTGSTGDTQGKDDSDGGTMIEGPAGTVKGSIVFTGSEIPEPTMIVNTTDPLVCGAEVSKRDLEVSPTNKGIRHVLVWLEDVKLPEGYSPPRQNLVLDNRNCQFEPHAAVTTVGSTVEATNSDDVFHTTNLYGPVTENMPLVAKGSSQKTVVRRAGTIQVKCDKHGWMQAFIRVDPHPFHAVTDANGEFSIANVPAGTYKLKAWHEVFYGQDLEVTVTPDETVTLEIKYPSEK